MIGEIHFVSYPFTDASGTKQRPTLIIGDNGDDREVIYITSKQKQSDIPLIKEDFEDGAIKLQSYVRISKSILLSKKLINADTYIATISQGKLEIIVESIIHKFTVLLQNIRKNQ